MWPSASKPHAPCCRGALLSNLSNCLNPLPLDLGPILADHQHKRARFMLNSFPADYRVSLRKPLMIRDR